MEVDRLPDFLGLALFAPIPFSGYMPAFAIALAGSPKLLIVDEPTAGLDPTERNRFLNLLADIGEDVVVILSTHIVEDVRELCSQMAIINKGQVVVLSSVAGYRGMPGSLGYGATKAAQINLFEALRATFYKTGIVFQTVSPGFVETPMTSTNTFPMPFLISSEVAAKHIRRGLESSKPEIVFPWQMATAMKIARLVPQRLWVKLLGRNA